jgi:ribosomal RNA-processing protein 8
VLSYDLVGDRGMVGGGKGEGWVVEADFLTSVPLPGRTGLGGSGASAEKSKRRKGKGKEEASEVVDVVVCCLSLMGTNWIGGIYEACRILKPGYVPLPPSF